MKGLAVHLGYAHCWPAGLNSKREFIRPKDRMIASGCFGAGNHPRPPQKKIKAPGGYKPRKTTAVLKRNVSEFCQKKSLIASWKNIILTWLDIGFFCCCFLSNEPLESPQPLTKVLDVLLADSQSKISHIASKRLWLWWSAGFFWGNFRGFFCGPLGPHSKIWGVSILEPQKTPRIFNIAPEK